MTTQVILLRGINVGGHHQVPMAELKALAGDLGHREPRTYVNSGNLVIESDRDTADVAAELEPALAERFGFDIPVMIRSGAEIAAILAANPYPDGDPKQVTIAFTADDIEPGAHDRMAELADAAERFRLAGREAYIDFAGGLGRSKLAAHLGRALGTPATTRNLRTVTKLAELAASG
jgi:uncharacterized protein (DUF1697 family)